jgi:hypothetical protein
MSKEYFISTDVETDGPIPGPHSMLSFGSAVFTLEDGLVDTYTANLNTLSLAIPDPNTMAWWNQTRNQHAYQMTRVNPQDPRHVMIDYSNWLKKYNPAVFVGYPAGFDFMFIYWYLINFTGHSPFSFSALDMKTYAMAKLRTPFKATTKRNFPQKWKDVPQKHTHIALDDAIEQGHIFMNMLKD